MSGRIPQQFIQDLVARSDLVETVQARIALTRRGQNYLACCPFHNEKTPSFTVSQDKQFYYCFGCGAHGNIIRFLMDYDRADFIDVIHDLAARAGVSIPESADHKQTTSYAELYPSLERATEYYEQELRQSQEAITYLKQRGLDGKTAKRFRIGFASPRWDGLMQYSQNNLTLRTYLAQNGLLVQKERSEHYYDRFRNRIMFPIRDVRGRVIAFGGRTLENDPAKYLNSPETPIFHKGNELYGLYEARQAHQRLDRVLIVEGYMDVVSLSQHGIHYAVATLGTATSAKHIQKLLRYTPELIFCFDGDRAGRQAAWRALTVALPLMNDGVEARFMFLPEQEDPDSLIQKIGKARFETLITEATPLSEFFFNALKEQIPLLSLDSKARFAKEARSYLDTMPSGLFQQLMIDQLALLIGVGAHETGTLSKLRDNTHALEPMSPPKIPAPLRLALALLLQEPTLVECMEGSNPLQLLEVPGKKLLFELISRYQQNPRLSVGELLAETEDPTKNRMIAELSAWEHQVSTTELKQTFLETLDRLRQLAQEQAISKLISKSKHTPLDEDEKNVLKQLLSNKAGV